MTKQLLWQTSLHFLLPCLLVMIIISVYFRRGNICAGNICIWNNIRIYVSWAGLESSQYKWKNFCICLNATGAADPQLPENQPLCHFILYCYPPRRGSGRLPGRPLCHFILCCRIMLLYYAAMLCCVFPATTLHHQTCACESCEHEAEKVEETGAGAACGGKLIACVICNH